MGAMALITSPTAVFSSRSVVATRFAFFVAGLAMATWAPLVPFAKARAGLDPAMLGALLLALGGGSILAMPVAGLLSARYGCRAVILGTGLCAMAMLAVLASASDVVVLAAALLVFGATIGSLDVSMNIQAVIVERASGRVMMSGFHGMFSLSGIVGAGGMSLLLGLGASPLMATAMAIAVMLAALGAAVPGLLAAEAVSGVGKARGPAFVWPRGRVLLIGVLCLAAFLTEGAVLDWSAVFLSSVRAVAADHAGLGYAAFSLTMTLGRFMGDRVVRRLGPVRVLALGACCAAAGIGVVALVPDWQMALVGFALVGLGSSNIVPVLFTAAGRQADMPPAAALPAVATLGYAGILAGPAVIGFVAQGFGLPAAFLLVAAMLIGVAWAARWLRD